MFHDGAKTLKKYRFATQYQGRVFFFLLLANKLMINLAKLATTLHHVTLNHVHDDHKNNNLLLS